VQGVFDQRSHVSDLEVRGVCSSRLGE
jgi:hypothetical protein